MAQLRYTFLRKEILAGLSTFSSIAYIILLNPLILNTEGMDIEAIMVATILVSAVSTFCVGFFSKAPFAIAPAMGINVYFQYVLIQELQASWQEALGIVCVAALIFSFLNVLKIRQKLLSFIPLSLTSGLACGIGLFLIRIGVENAFLGDLKLVVFTSLLIGFFLYKRISGAIFFPLLLSFGIFQWQQGEVFSNAIISSPPSISPTLFQLDLLGALKSEFIFPITTIVLALLMDSSATLFILSKKSDRIDLNGNIKDIDSLQHVDGIGSIFGAILGTSNVTIHMESIIGILEGGRTKITSYTIAFCFILSLFFTPIIGLFPLFLTAPCLITIGCMMCLSIQEIRWNKKEEFIASSLILILIPLTKNIGTGIFIGLIVYYLIKAINKHLSS